MEVDAADVNNKLNNNNNVQQELDPNEIKVQRRKIKKIIVKKVAKSQPSSSSQAPLQKPEIEGSTTGKESVKFDKRRIRVPVARFSPLKKSWEQLYKPIVEKMGLEIMFDPKNRYIDLRV